MIPVHELDIAGFERSLVVFCDVLKVHRESLNALNVYPIPDGDTGTNMSLTLESVVKELATVSDGNPAAKWKAIGHGSLMGARGNSGVILSQILRGLVQTLEIAPQIKAAELAEALSVAAAAAYESVMNPVEGTILTVARETAAEASRAAAAGASLATMLERCAAVGKASLDETPELLPALKEAGVVDAGGAGFLLFLDALRFVVAGIEMPPAPVVERARLIVAERHGEAGSRDVGSLRYEVMFFLEAEDGQIDAFKSRWAEIGDSIVVVGGDGLWNCHVHSNDIGGCIEAGIEAGRPKQIRVTDLFEEVDHIEDLSPSNSGDEFLRIIDRTPATTGVVAVALGRGVHRIFESLGVHALISGGQTMNPSTGQLVQAVDQIDADEVIILPNNKNIVPVAQQVDGESEKRVEVVPTGGIAEGFASLLEFDPAADASANRLRMTAAAAAVIAGEVTCAVREADTDAGQVKPGDWIGLDQGGVRSIGSSIRDAAEGLLNHLVQDEHELVTVIAGEDANSATNDALEAWFMEHRPGVEAEFHEGGQPLYPYYFGIE